jgi:hypothetical protein
MGAERGAGRLPGSASSERNRGMEAARGRRNPVEKNVPHVVLWAKDFRLSQQRTPAPRKAPHHCPPDKNAMRSSMPLFLPCCSVTFFVAGPSQAADQTSARPRWNGAWSP